MGLTVRNRKFIFFSAMFDSLFNGLDCSSFVSLNARCQAKKIKICKFAISFICCYVKLEKRFAHGYYFVNDFNKISF